MTLLGDVVTGKGLVVNGFSTVARCRVMRTVDSEPSAASNQQGGLDRPIGNVDFQGYIWAFGHTPPYFPNQTFTFTYTINGIVYVTAANVMCTGIDIVVPTYDEKKENCVYYIVYFGCGGTDLADGTGAITDATNPIKLSVKGLYAAINGTAVPYTTEQMLSIRAMAARDVSGSLNGVYMRPLGNYDWTFKLSRRVNAFTDALLPVQNSIVSVQQYVTPSLYWALNYGRVMHRMATNASLDKKAQTADIIIEKCIAGTSNGSIITPGNVQIWP